MFQPIFIYRGFSPVAVRTPDNAFLHLRHNPGQAPPLQYQHRNRICLSTPVAMVKVEAADIALATIRTRVIALVFIHKRSISDPNQSIVLADRGEMNLAIGAGKQLGNTGLAVGLKFSSLVVIPRKRALRPLLLTARAKLGRQTFRG